MSDQQLISLGNNPELKGSIAFAEIPKQINSELVSSTFAEPGVAGRTSSSGIQTASAIKPSKVMSLPEGMSHSVSGDISFAGKAFTKETLQGEAMHDWMQDFARNLKSLGVADENLPTGTAELLNSTRTSEYESALKKYLIEHENPKFRKTADEVSNLKLLSRNHNLPGQDKPVLAYSLGSDSTPKYASISNVDKIVEKNKTTAGVLDSDLSGMKGKISTSNVNDLKFTHNGQTYLLHHSNADIPIGESIKASGTISAKQTTAGDTTKGFSYGWDVADIESVKNAASNQAGARNIYLTTANPESVLPDINVSGSSARAVRGDLSILDKVSIPAEIDFGSREARGMIYGMLEKHGIPLGTKAEGNMINAAYILSRGQEAQDAYTVSRTEMKALSLADRFEQIKAANSTVPPANTALYEIYDTQGTEGLTKKLLSDLNERVSPSNDHVFQRMLKAGDAEKNAGRSLGAISMADLKSAYSASITRGDAMEVDLMLTTREEVMKNVEQSRRIRSRVRAGRFSQTEDMLSAASRASSSVVARDSAGMRLAGAAATILRKRVL